MEINTAFNIGDIVYKASVDKERKFHECPDCSGTKEWKCTSPAGVSYTFSCPRCTGHITNDKLRLDYYVWGPTTKKLTIGSIRTNSHDVEEPVTYMCTETGVGSGAVYKECNFYRTDEAAFEAAKIRAEEQNKECPEIKKAYLRSLKLSTYMMHLPRFTNVAKSAWRTIIQDLDEDCGYEGSELEEPDVAKHVQRYKEAWNTLDAYFGAIV